MEIKVLDLFSGIGGFSLGLERAGMETIAFCENNLYCRKVLKKHWPDIPIFEDIRKLTKKDLNGQTINLICGGFPCQSFSVAGKRKGKEDDRYLWPEMLRVIGEIRPSWILCENVPGIINMALDDCLFDLEALGYATATFIIPAAGVGAPHRRDRVWIVAYREKPRGWKLPIQPRKARQANIDANESGQDVADAQAMHAQRFDNKQGQVQPGGSCRRSLEPRLGGTFNDVSPWLDGTWERGVPRVTTIKKNRANRLKALGNAVVPQIVEILGRMILEAEIDWK